jgi:D-lactate dehydrogenase (cytochrome)
MIFKPINVYRIRPISIPIYSPLIRHFSSHSNLYNSAKYNNINNKNNNNNNNNEYNDSTNSKKKTNFEKDSKTISNKYLNSSIFSNTALIFIGVIIGTSWASYNLCKNPPEFLFPLTSTLPLDKTLSPIYNESKKILPELKLFLKPDQISESDDELSNHADSYFSSDHPLQNEYPDLVVFPESTEEVSRILKLAHENNIPIVPYTGGTSLEGHFIATRRGIVIDLSRLNKIIELHKEDLDIIVQPAVCWEDLSDYLEPYGLLFGPDPGPGACIGGMCGTSCSGTNAARYGTMRENVISLTVVLADGKIIKTRRRPKKTSAGYNLTNLFIGSEGTLGIITEITLKLNVKSFFENVAVVSFPTMKDAANAVAKIVQSGVQFNAMELLDKEMMYFVNQSGNVTNKYNELPTLMFKLGGSSKEIVKSITNDIQKICNDCNCGHKNFRFASTDEEKEELWTARKVALWSTLDAGRALYGNDAQIWTTDVAVPISKLVDSLIKTRKWLDDEKFLSSIVSHAGDGNYHVFLIYEKKDYQRVANVVQKMITMALEMDGTVTGEHGVGIGKREFLREELGDVTIDLMRKIKFALDPLLLLNPDKIFQIDPNEKRH